MSSDHSTWIVKDRREVNVHCSFISLQEIEFENLTNTVFRQREGDDMPDEGAQYKQNKYKYIWVSFFHNGHSEDSQFRGVTLRNKVLLRRNCLYILVFYFKLLDTSLSEQCVAHMYQTSIWNISRSVLNYVCIISPTFLFSVCKLLIRPCCFKESWLWLFVSILQTFSLTCLNY